MPRSRHHLSRTGLCLGALTALLATGCSFDVSIGDDRSVRADDVAEQASAVLSEQVGQTPDEFTCADDLPAEVGASVRCELTAGGESLGVTVTTTSVEGDDVNFDVVVDDESTG